MWPDMALMVLMVASPAIARRARRGPSSPSSPAKPSEARRSPVDVGDVWWPHVFMEMVVVVVSLLIAVLVISGLGVVDVWGGADTV